MKWKYTEGGKEGRKDSVEENVQKTVVIATMDNFHLLGEEYQEDPFEVMTDGFVETLKVLSFIDGEERHNSKDDYDDNCDYAKI